MVRRITWLNNFYITVKAIAAIVASLVAIYLAPMPDFWKGIVLGILSYNFFWLFLYFYLGDKTEAHEN